MATKKTVYLHKHALALGLLLAILTSCTGFFSWPAIYRMQMEAAVPEYDSLNRTLYLGLPPPPPGAEQDTEYSTGLSPSLSYYGRTLIVAFASNLSEAEVLEHYETYLFVRGWVRVFASSMSRYTIYSDQHACIEISFHRAGVAMSQQGYLIQIWHDFERQSFSPWTPPRWLLQLHDGGKSTFAECRY